MISVLIVCVHLRPTRGLVRAILVARSSFKEATTLKTFKWVSFLGESVVLKQFVLGFTHELKKNVAESDFMFVISQILRQSVLNADMHAKSLGTLGTSGTGGTCLCPSGIRHAVTDNCDGHERLTSSSCGSRFRMTSMF